MTFYFIHFLLLHSFYCTEELSHERGKDFVDNFETYDDSLWIQDNGTVHCTNHRVRGCALMTKRNIGYYTLAANNFFQDRHILSLWMLNNCNSDLCCPNEKCTAYTSAQMISRKVYSYGIYLFLARAVGYNVRGPDVAPNAYSLSCFALRNNLHNDVKLEISWCFSNRNSYQSTLMFRYNEIIHRQKILFDFDAAERIEVYGIEWKPKGVTWFVNEKAYHAFAVEVPKIHSHMNIHLYVLPLANDIGFGEKSVAMVIHLYRITFLDRSTLDENKNGNKDELLVLGHVQSPVIYIMAFSFFVFMISFSFWICHGFSRDHSGEYFLLKDSDEETLTRATRS